MINLDERLIQAKPSQRQVKYLETGYNCFIHFSMNTFTNSEWGDGTENPSQFAPSDIDTDEWVMAAKNGGMKGIILTCKHHDGFCLWPSKYTEHSIKNSPYRDGKGDIVRELSESCKKYGMKFGVYLSPWDRNSKYYGNGKEYDDYYIDQLTELLTEYGDIFAVWLDGACGENEQGNIQVYDWGRYFQVVRKLQPEAVISICGPDIRWCGNEAGVARESEWSVVSFRMCNPEQTGELSQKEDDASFRERPIDPTLEDLGSRDALADEKRLIYYPSEMDVSIRPGWFYHKDEDDKVRDVDNLFDIYMKSVGHNSTLLLNIPVMPDGHMNEVDIHTLKKLGERIEQSFRNNLIGEATVSSMPETDANGSTLGDILAEKKCFFEGTSRHLSVDIKWNEKKEVHYLVMQENIEYSQRVEQYVVYCIDKEGQKVELFTGTTIGYKQIVPLYGVRTDEIIIEITDSRVAPVIANIEVY